MTQIYCEFIDCQNNEEKNCHAAAIRLSVKDCCLTYNQLNRKTENSSKQQGDKLLWDKEFFEDDPLDDEAAL